MIDTILFEYEKIDDLSTEESKETYVVSGSFDKGLNVELHQRLSDLDKAKSYKDIVDLLKTMYHQKGCIVKNVCGRSDSQYEYVDNDLVGTSTFIVEYELIR